MVTEPTLVLKNEYINKTTEDIKLSPRELECLFHLNNKKSINQIASLLNLSPRTVESYLHNVKLKFNCQNITQLVQKIASIEIFDV